MLQTQPFPVSGPDQHEGIWGREQYTYGENCRYQHCDEDGVTPPNVVARNVRARQTAPCKHFMRTGHCTVGDACDFIHDLSLEIIDSEKAPRINRHCWAHIQGGCCVRSCRYFHPYDIRPYQKYTPCYAWDLCPNRQNCPFRHPEQPVFPREGITHSVQHVSGGPMAMMQTNMDYSATTNFSSPSTEEPRTLNRGLHIPSPTPHYRGIYAAPPPSYANGHVRAGHGNYMASLEVLPGPSFEDSPPQLKWHRGHKIHNINSKGVNPWLLP